MSRLKKIKHKTNNPKKQSQFQRLWKQAENLRHKQQVFEAQMATLMKRVQTEIVPVEQDCLQSKIPLLLRLLTLAQRKSLAQWERRAVHHWTGDLIAELQENGIFTKEVEDEIARYNAYAVGVPLDETSETPLAEQMEEILQAEKEFEEEQDPFENEEAWRAMIEAEIERELDKQLGKPPAKPNIDQPTPDLFAEETDIAYQQSLEDYQRTREALRQELLAEQPGDDDMDEDDDEDLEDIFSSFFADDDEPHQEEKAPAQKIDNALFTRLFRATAAVLHPDREPDETVQKTKQALMASLLEARKTGDLLTIIELHQQHVDSATGLTASDEKSLLDILKSQIQALKEKKDDLAYATPLHAFVYQTFYGKTKQATNTAFKRHIKGIRAEQQESQQLAKELTSVKNLKTLLREQQVSPEFGSKEIQELAEFAEILSQVSRARGF